MGLPKLFHTTVTAVSQWSLLEKDSFAVGTHPMNFLPFVLKFPLSLKFLLSFPSRTATTSVQRQC